METTNRRRRFFALAVATCGAILIAAVAGVSSTFFLHWIENALAFTSSASWWVRPVSMAGAGLLAGLLWWALRRKTLVDVNQAVREQSDTFSLGKTTVDAALQLFIVGAGASIGRETAPRQLAAAFTHRVSRWLYLSPADRAILVAAAAGAALGAVYNTPWAGAAYSICIILERVNWLSVLLACASSLGGVFLSRLVLGPQAFYDFPPVQQNWQTWAWIALCIPCAALLGWIFKALTQHAKIIRIPDVFLPLSIAMALGVTGLLSLYDPNISGNGVLILAQGIEHNITLTGFLFLIVLKPLFTLLTLGAGARGGVLTPALALGASFGGASALLLGQESLIPLFMMLGAGAVLAVSENSILFGALFTVELIHAPAAVWPAFAVVAGGSVVLIRILEKRYSGRR